MERRSAREFAEGVLQRGDQLIPSQTAPNFFLTVILHCRGLARVAVRIRPDVCAQARSVTTPVLILSDVGDNRDPFATSAMYWRALRDNGKDATLRVWPIQGHFPTDPVRVVDVYHYWIEFIADRFR